MHFYADTPKGVEPRHKVLNAKASKEAGKDVYRDSRMSDAKKALKDKGEVWFPSVTTVMDILAKPALVNWKVDQHLKAARTINPIDRLPPRTEEDYIREVKRLTKIEMDKAPDAGTDFHQRMEDYIKHGMVPDEWVGLCANVAKVIERETGATMSEWTAEHNFVSPLGYGGQIDLLVPNWTIDFKTKQLTSKFKPGKMCYEDHSRQLSAYREGVSKPKNKVANVFVCLEDGQIDFHEHKEEDLQKGWSIFQHALAIWKLQAGL